MPQPHAPDPKPRATILSRKIFATMSPSPANKAFVEHISAHTGNLPSESLLRPYFVNSEAELFAYGPPAQNVHLSILPLDP